MTSRIGPQDGRGCSQCSSHRWSWLDGETLARWRDERFRFSVGLALIIRHDDYVYNLHQVLDKDNYYRTALKGGDLKEAERKAARLELLLARLDEADRSA